MFSRRSGAWVGYQICRLGALSDDRGDRDLCLPGRLADPRCLGHLFSSRDRARAGRGLAGLSDRASFQGGFKPGVTHLPFSAKFDFAFDVATPFAGAGAAVVIGGSIGIPPHLLLSPFVARYQIHLMISHARSVPSRAFMGPTLQQTQPTKDIRRRRTKIKMTTAGRARANRTRKRSNRRGPWTGTKRETRSSTKNISE